MRAFFSTFLALFLLPSLGSSTELTSPSQYALEKGLQFFHGEGVTQDFTTAAKYFEQAADLGNGEAYLNLGFLYDLGIGVQQDYQQAAKWYRMAAAQGDATAQFNLGILYSFGRGVEKNFEKAANWYTQAAEQGYVDAQYNLGVLYEEGRGVQRDPLTADKWYILAAASDHKGAISRHEALAVQLSPDQLMKAWESAYEWGVANVSYADENA